MSASNTWNHWDAIAPTAPPLRNVSGKSDSAGPGIDDRAVNPPTPTRWSLVSSDGRATMRLPKRFVVGSGACCDLHLSEQGIATHHAMLNVEDDLAYVTPMSDAPTLLDGEAISGRCRLRSSSALTFGAATFRVQHDGPPEDWDTDETEWKKATEWQADDSDWGADATDSEVGAALSEADVTESEVDVTESKADATGSEVEEIELVVVEKELPRNEPIAPQRTPPNAPTAEARRGAAPRSSPRIERDARVRLHVAAKKRRRTGWIGWVVTLAAMAAAAFWFLPIDLFEQFGWNPDARPTKVDLVPQSVVAPTVTPTTAMPSPSEPVTLTEPKPAPVPEARAPSPEPAAQPLPTNKTPAAVSSVSTLLSEAAALEDKGQWVTPGQNAAQRYVRVLQVQPDSATARARLDHVVGGVARDASDMIMRQRFDSARRLLDQLAVAVPENARPLVGKDARGQWRVVQLLLDADALMQQYRLVGPDDPNAVGLLREALRIDPNNAIADEMLAKAYGLQAEREKQ